jgi:hypothetical protein
MNLKYFPLLIAVSLVATGCITANSLGPAAGAQHDQLVKLRQNVAVARRMNALFSEAVLGAHLLNRVAIVDDDLSAVLEDRPARGKGWELFVGNDPHIAKVFNDIKSRAPSLTTAQRAELEQRHGWIAAAVLDKKFTPSRAWGLQQALRSLETRHRAANPSRFAELAAELFAPYDGVLRQRLDLAAALRSLRTKLDTELEGALNRATRLNDAMLRAANASAGLGAALGSVSRSDEARVFYDRFADRHLTNPVLRRGLEELLNEVINAR